MIFLAASGAFFWLAFIAFLFFAIYALLRAN